MEEKKNSEEFKLTKKMVIGLVITACIIFAGFDLVEIMINKKDCPKCVECKKDNTYDSIAGIYKINEGEEKSYTFDKDGLFEYVEGKSIIFGNYIIKNDKIILNYLFNDISCNAFNFNKSSKELTIKDNKNIADEGNIYTYSKDNDTYGIGVKDNILTSFCHND